MKVKIQRPIEFRNQPLSHTHDPATSYEAADRMAKSGELETQENDVWIAIKFLLHCLIISNTAPDFTARELSDFSDVNYHLIQRRLKGIRNKGYIERISINNNGNPPWKKRNGCCVYRRLK